MSSLDQSRRAGARLSPPPASREFPVTGDETVTVLEPRAGWQALEMGELWRYRNLLGSLLWRDIKASHKQTVLGMSWLVVSPLITVAVYTTVFGQVFKLPSDGHPYPLLVFSGQYLWGAFSAALTAVTGSVVSNAHFIQKVYFPRLLLPISAALSSILNLGLVFACLLVVMASYGYWPSAKTLMAPLIAVQVLATALGLGMLLAPLNVRYRDIGRAAAFAVQLGFFVTPVLYPLSEVPVGLRQWLVLNPVAGSISMFRWSLYGAPMDREHALLSVLMTMVLVVTGAYFYTRQQRDFADVI